MKALRRHLMAQGIPEAGLAVQGIVGLAFAGGKGGLRSRVDEYVPALLELRLTRGGKTVLELPACTDLFTELAASLAKAVRLPLDPEQVPHGTSAPYRRARLIVPYERLAILDRANADFHQAMLRNDRARLDEIAWIRFEQSALFDALPCTREEFLGLYREYRDSDWRGNVDFQNYYAWFMHSRRHVGADGALTREARQAAESLLAEWARETPEHRRYWLVESLEAHPRHEPLFEALADAWERTRPPEA